MYYIIVENFSGWTAAALHVLLAVCVVVLVVARFRTRGHFRQELLVVRALDDVLAVHIVAHPFTGRAVA